MSRDVLGCYNVCVWGAPGTSWVEARHAAHCPTGHEQHPPPRPPTNQRITCPKGQPVNQALISSALHSSMCDMSPYCYWNQRPGSAGDHCGFCWYLG